MTRLAYLANLRLPTEKAHGVQIAQQCDGFIDAGARVALVVPTRRNPIDVDVATYYDLPPRFRVIHVPAVDVIPLADRLSGRAAAALVLANAVRVAGRLVGAVRTAAPDLVHTREVLTAAASVRAGLPTVYEAHSMPGPLQRRVLQAVAARLRLVVVLTHILAEELVSLGVPAERVLVAPDAARADRFVDLPSKEEACRRLGLPDDVLRIGYVGRFETVGNDKGVGDLVEAVAELAREALPVELTCVGGSVEEQEPLRRRISAAGLDQSRVRLVTHRPHAEVPVWMRTFDVAVLPLPDRAFLARYVSPLKLFEYQAAGLPIVATELPSIREVLDEEAAVLVRPGSPSRLAEGIRRLLEDDRLRTRLAAAGMERAAANTWAARGRRILEHVT